MIPFVVFAAMLKLTKDDQNPPCSCGFIYPRNPQGQWTDEEYQSVAEHQQFHIRQQQPKTEGV